MSQFIENFNSLQDVIDNYSAPKDALEGATVYLAWYGYGNYCGSSFVLFEKTGKLYEVNGFHCSCHGLEGQWEPEETSWEALSIRDLSRGDSGADEADKALKALVAEHLSKAGAQ